MLDYYKNGRFSHTKDGTTSLSDWISKEGIMPGQKFLISKFEEEDHIDNEFRSFWIERATRKITASNSDGLTIEGVSSNEWITHHSQWCIAEVWHYDLQP